ncbi:MAG: WYL domain-containing protein [Bifidobacteriaceae bacterium]|jgi:predicted DNA-binding transcriptional regulator YafY|nr:WYL domain-containing protein [Bifidobacteriaceae bacterium]MCI1979340.1 WYL domain-containing protein [Bifidobacteriaceae bacterium]
MAEGSSNGRRRFSDKWGKHELDVLAVLSSAFPQWLTSRQIAQRVKAYADSYGELADQAAKAAFAKQFQRDRAKLAAMGIAIESRQPEYSSKSDGQDFASYRLQLGDEPRIRMQFEPEEMPILAAANYLAQSLSASSNSLQSAASDHVSREDSKDSRTAPRVPHVPVPGLGLDSIAPGLGTQKIPKNLIDVIDSRRFAATVEADGELINVAYTDSDDLATFVLEHPGSSIKSPQEAADAFERRLNAAVSFDLADLGHRSKAVPVAESVVPASVPVPVSSTSKNHSKRGLTTSSQTGSEVDRRLRLMLFLSAHLGEEYTLDELAERFIGHSHTEEEKRRAIAVIRKDIGTLTTVSDDGEVAGSQFFDIDWSLLEDSGVVSATNSLGLERLAGISPQYLSLLTASVSYLAHSPLLVEEARQQALKLYVKLRGHTTPGSTPWLSLTGYELEPPALPVVQEAIKAGASLDIEYTDGAGRTREKRVIPAKVFVDEGVYYIAVWNMPAHADPDEEHPVISASTSNEWSVLRVARIGKAELIEQEEPIRIPDVPVDKLRQWSFDNGTEAVFITDTTGLPFLTKLPGATVEPWDDGEKVHLTVTSDSWFVAFCISHARHIRAVGPQTLRTMITARAQRELSVSS